MTIAAATGLISGTTGGTAASYAVTIRATDSTGASGTTSFTWGVGTTASRGPADPGLGKMWFGANNGGNRRLINANGGAVVPLTGLSAGSCGGSA